VGLRPQLVRLGAGLSHDPHGLGPSRASRLLRLALGRAHLLGDPLPQRLGVGLGFRLAAACAGVDLRDPSGGLLDAAAGAVAGVGQPAIGLGLRLGQLELGLSA